MDTVIYLLSCAAMPRGCRSALAIDGPPGIDMLELDLEVPEDKRVHGLITASGWRLEHGKWVCANHPFETPAGPVAALYWPTVPTTEEMEAAKRAVLETAAELLTGQQAVGLHAKLATVERHKPNPTLNGLGPYCEVCVGGYEGVSEWPCETVKDIARALWIEVGGGRASV